MHVCTHNNALCESTLQVFLQKKWRMKHFSQHQQTPASHSQRNQNVNNHNNEYCKLLHSTRYNIRKKWSRSNLVATSKTYISRHFRFIFDLFIFPIPLPLLQGIGTVTTVRASPHLQWGTFPMLSDRPASSPGNWRIEKYVGNRKPRDHCGLKIEVKIYSFQL